MATLDVTQLIADCYPFFHATGPSDVIFTDDGQLTRSFADKLKFLAETFGVFLLRDIQSVAFVSGQQVYNAPARHLATVHISYQGIPLIASSSKELEALDDDFQDTVATVQNPISRFFEDKAGQNQIGFYPVPGAGDAGNHPEVIYWAFPCDIYESHINVNVFTPACIGDMLEFQVIADQYRKQSDFEMPESAAAIDQLVAIYTGGLKAIWGPSQ